MVNVGIFVEGMILGNKGPASHKEIEFVRLPKTLADI